MGGTQHNRIVTTSFVLGNDDNFLVHDDAHKSAYVGFEIRKSGSVTHAGQRMGTSIPTTDEPRSWPSFKRLWTRCVIVRTRSLSTRWRRAKDDTPFRLLDPNDRVSSVESFRSQHIVPTRRAACATKRTVPLLLTLRCRFQRFVLVRASRFDSLSFFFFQGTWPTCAPLLHEPRRRVETRR